MAARGQVKTMVPRARSTLEGHSEVKQTRATHGFSCFYTSQFSSFAAYDRKTMPSKVSRRDSQSQPALYTQGDMWGSMRCTVRGGWSLLILRRYLPGERVQRSTAHSCPSKNSFTKIHRSLELPYTWPGLHRQHFTNTRQDN